MNAALEHLSGFVTDARWFGGKGRGASLTGVRRLAVLAAPEGPDSPGVAIDLVEVSYPDGGTESYQLPLAFYPDPPERLDHARIGDWEDADFGHCHVYDAPHDRDAMARWLAAFDDAAAGSAERAGVTFHRVPGHDLDVETHSTLFTGEQSNTSVAYGDDSLMKIFRRLTPGVNPDIAIHEVLTRAGSDHVAALYGWLEAPGPDGGVLHLAMLQQFLRTASDGFELAKASVRNLFAEADLHPDEVGGDFAAESARLGTALAEIHADLAREFPTEPMGPERLAEIAAQMRGRLAEAIEVVPELAEHEAYLTGVYDALAEVTGAEAQRIHGDLHLGQTLRTVKGWKVVDFEGEPAKSLAERTLPDSALRDVAGMLRSFDYAPAVIENVTAETDTTGADQRAYRAAEWSARNRQAFLEAYAGGDLSDDQSVLLAAYEADKAVYEAVYETRNRPTWVAIPLEALARLAQS